MITSKCSDCEIISEFLYPLHHGRRNRNLSWTVHSPEAVPVDARDGAVTIEFHPAGSHNSTIFNFITNADCKIDTMPSLIVKPTKSLPRKTVSAYDELLLLLECCLPKSISGLWITSSGIEELCEKGGLILPERFVS